MSEALERHQQLLLLGGVLLMLIIQPVIAGVSMAARIGYDALIGGVVWGVLFVVFGTTRERLIAFALALPALVLIVALYAMPQRPPEWAAIAYHVSVAVFCGFTAVEIVRNIFRRSAIRFDDIIGAFSGYLLLGVAWGSFYLVAELLAPGSFAVSDQIQWQLDDWHLRRALFNYVSFATMTSLGYSDVTAITPLANTLTWIEVISAQFYIAVVIAQIVGMKIAHVVVGNATGDEQLHRCEREQQRGGRG